MRRRVVCGASIAFLATLSLPTVSPAEACSRGSVKDLEVRKAGGFERYYKNVLGCSSNVWYALFETRDHDGSRLQLYWMYSVLKETLEREIDLDPNDLDGRTTRYVSGPSRLVIQPSTSTQSFTKVEGQGPWQYTFSAIGLDGSPKGTYAQRYPSKGACEQDRARSLSNIQRTLSQSNLSAGERRPLEHLLKTASPCHEVGTRAVGAGGGFELGSPLTNEFLDPLAEAQALHDAISELVSAFAPEPPNVIEQMSDAEKKSAVDRLLRAGEGATSSPSTKPADPTFLDELNKAIEQGQGSTRSFSRERYCEELVAYRDGELAQDFMSTLNRVEATPTTAELEQDIQFLQGIRDELDEDMSRLGMDVTSDSFGLFTTIMSEVKVVTTALLSRLKVIGDKRGELLDSIRTVAEEPLKCVLDSHYSFDRTKGCLSAVFQEKVGTAYASDYLQRKARKLPVKGAPTLVRAVETAYETARDLQEMEVSLDGWSTLKADVIERQAQLDRQIDAVIMQLAKREQFDALLQTQIQAIRAIDGYCGASSDGEPQDSARDSLGP